jgi:hypothetical protein
LKGAVDRNGGTHQHAFLLSLRAIEFRSGSVQRRLPGIKLRFHEL